MFSFGDYHKAVFFVAGLTSCIVMTLYIAVSLPMGHKAALVHGIQIAGLQ